MLISHRFTNSGLDSCERRSFRSVAEQLAHGAGDHCIGPQLHDPATLALAEILVADLDDTLASGVLHRCGGAAACTYIARDDLGLSAATILAGDKRESRILNETMERSYTGDEVADAISRRFGKPVRYEAVAAEDWPAYMIEKWGMPPSLAASTVGTMRAIEAGQFDMTTDDYRSVTGRPPRTLDEFLAEVQAARV